MEKLRTIRLYGWLGNKFGRVHRLAVDSTAEAVRALCVVIPGFEKELIASLDRGAAYACFLGKRNLGEDELKHPVGDEDIRIAPVVQGAKRAGVFQTILGAALVAVGAVLSFTPLAAASPYLMQFGAALAIGGVVQMLSTQQRGLSTKDSPDNGASYNFNGPVNTSAQGNPVPLLYGEMIVGSAVVSAGIYAEDQV
ncbi:tail assembly protein [Bordetella genomosp. 9]|uniref:Phage tail protein n=1 Tax=Bordetella genomosp. 9 TaxID=1416803 RepID=A0A1W6YYV5_9BORD|nr:tail assembly protein [Bordetella genomosp. 9]ARP85773.1 phage tail protein [Bordetella genomosp. 9]